jgi:hypothetical protein
MSGALVRFGTARLPGAACTGATALRLEDPHTGEGVDVGADVAVNGQLCSYGVWTVPASHAGGGLIILQDCAPGSAPCEGTTAYGILDAA